MSNLGGYQTMTTMAKNVVDLQNLFLLLLLVDMLYLELGN